MIFAKKRQALKTLSKTKNIRLHGLPALPQNPKSQKILQFPVLHLTLTA